MGIGPLNFMQKAVFLDRDGVINQPVVRKGKPYPPDSVSDLWILPGVDEALNLLKKNNYRLIIVTNQPDVGRGKQKLAVVEEINNKILELLPIDAIRVCYHGSDDECDCRKPKPGLLLSAAKEFEIDLSKSYMIGDRWKDIEAGKRAGCRTVFIDYSYDEEKPIVSDYQSDSLLNSVKWILENENKSCQEN